LWPNIRFLPSIVAEKNEHICSMCIKIKSRQTGSRNLTGPKTLPTIWGIYMKLVTKYQISAINSCWEKCDEKCAYSVDSRYLEFDGTMEKIRVNRSSTQEELRRYRKCGLFNNERETTRAKFWRAKTSIACPYSRNDFKHILCFCCCFFLSVKFFESCETTDNF
jgi:hypothetical protein